LKSIPKILVAESNPQAICLIKKTFDDMSFGFNLTCTTVETAKMLKTHTYDLFVFSSVGCVNVNSLIQKKIPSLVLLENLCDDSQLVGFENCDYLKKPFRRKVFSGKVRGLLQHSKNTDHY